MESSKESNSKCTEFVQDLAKYKTSAAKALKDFEIAYSDVMGFDISFETNRSSEVETESTEISSSSSTNSTVVNYGAYKYTKPHRFFNPTYISQSGVHLQYPRFVVPLPKMPYNPWNSSAKFYNFNKYQWCNSCVHNKNDHSLDSDDNGISIERHHPMSHSNKCTKYKTFVNDNPINITVPEPFNMTIRDENQKFVKELKKQKLKAEINEKVEKEMRVKIHSNPIPAHIYVPLYQQMTELNLARQELRRKKSAERIQEIVKPFNISQTSKLRKSDSMPDLRTEGKSCLFRARPVPKTILNSKISEKLKNKEELRQSRIIQRAKSMLIDSSLPFTSDRSVKQLSTNVNLKHDGPEKFKKPYIHKVHKSSDTITRKESKKVMIDWNAKVQKIACQKTHNIDTAHEGNLTNHEERYNKFLKNQKKTLGHYIRMTSAALLREQEIRKELEDNANNNDNVQYKKEIKKHVEKKLRRVIPSNHCDDIKNKLRNYS